MSIFKVGILTSVGLVLAPLVADAQLAVTVSAPKVVGQKAIVPLVMKNGFKEEIKSARAVVFLLDEQGKMVGQGSQWVIGGRKDKAGLAAGQTNVFNFVISSQKPFSTTNLSTKISFSRVLLEGGRSVNVVKEVGIEK
jgi:hypothetical protein